MCASLSLCAFINNPEPAPEEKEMMKSVPKLKVITTWVWKQQPMALKAGYDLGLGGLAKNPPTEEP